MKYPLMMLAGLLALSACGLGAALPPPAAIADRTVIDEKAALGIEVAYSVAGRLVELAVDTGRLKGPAATRADELDAKIAQAVGAARLAYDAGNSASYEAAGARAQALIEELTNLVMGGGAAR